MRNCLASINSSLKRLKNILPADHNHRVDATSKQSSNSIPLQAIALVLQAMDLNKARAKIFAAVQRAQRSKDLRASSNKHISELKGLCHRRFNPIQVKLGSSLLDVVDDVVQRSSKRIAIASVKRCTHAPPTTHAVDDVVGDAIALLLACSQFPRKLCMLGKLSKQIAQQLGRELNVMPRLLNKHRQGCIS